MPGVGFLPCNSTITTEVGFLSALSVIIIEDSFVPHSVTTTKAGFVPSCVTITEVGFATWLSPRQKRSKTRFIFPPFSIEIILVWSSSLTQTKKFFCLLCQIPRESGQSRAIPAHVRRGDTGLSKRK